MLDEVVATVNGEPIIREELYRLLEAWGTPPGASLDQDKSIYEMTLEQTINGKLLKQYLKGQKALDISPQEVDKAFADYAEQFKKAGQDVNIALAERGVTAAQVKDDMSIQLRWQKYIQAVSTPENLQKFVAANKDVFNRTQVKASHILVAVKPDASAADKQKAIEKLTALKQDIEAKKLTFADAANKYSEDESNKTSPRGGDLGFFERRALIEQLAAAAFAMKVGQISNPIETSYGYHLLTVTERIEGKPIDIKQNEMAIKNDYAADLHDRIIAVQRTKSKITQQPMPADFFPNKQELQQPPANGPAPGSLKNDPAKTSKPATPKTSG